MFFRIVSIHNLTHIIFIVSVQQYLKLESQLILEKEFFIMSSHCCNLPSFIEKKDKALESMRTSSEKRHSTKDLLEGL